MKGKKLKPMKSIILLSGGIDSATVLAMTKLREDREPIALLVGYGQRHAVELEAAVCIAAHYKTPIKRIDVPLRDFVDSPLTDAAKNLPVRTLEEIRQTPGASPAYVPARNTVLAALGLALAETEGAGNVVLGCNADDVRGFPDCRPAWIQAMKALFPLATAKGCDLYTPLTMHTKADVVSLASKLNVPLHLTCSCYQPFRPLTSGEFWHCGRCDACIIRRDAFEQAGVPDPTRYMVEL